jgi:hypothetical protein
MNYLGIPFWLVLAACAVPTIARQLRASRKDKQGHCCRCGYDLRATPDLCPECGNVPEKPPVISTWTAIPIFSPRRRNSESDPRYSARRGSNFNVERWVIMERCSTRKHEKGSRRPAGNGEQMQSINHRFRWFHWLNTMPWSAPKSVLLSFNFSFFWRDVIPRPNKLRGTCWPPEPWFAPEFRNLRVTPESSIPPSTGGVPCLEEGASGKEQWHGESEKGSFPDYNSTAGVPAVRILLAGLQGRPPLRLRILFPTLDHHEHSRFIKLANDHKNLSLWLRLRRAAKSVV